MSDSPSEPVIPRPNADRRATPRGQDVLTGIRLSLIDKMWRGLALVALIGVPLSLLRSLDTGWLPLYTAHAVIGVMVVMIYATRRWLSYRLLVTLMLLMFWSVGMGGAISLGLLGAGIWWLSISTLLISVLVSMRWGIISVFAVLGVLLLVGYGYVAGMLSLGFDANQYLRSPSSWLVLLVGASLMPIVVFTAIAEYQRTTQQLLDTVARQARQVADKNDQLKRVNEALRDFTGIVSHDLKEPIRGVSALAGFLLEDQADQLDAEGQQRLHKIRDNCHRLTRMINDLLRVSRLEHGKIEPQPVDLASVMQEVQDSVAELIRERNAELRVAPALPRIEADRVRITELLFNLVANALRYNDKPDAWVEVSGTTHPDYWELVVADNGCGIEPAAQERIFSAFTRQHSDAAFGSGSGMGLLFVRKIAALHGGDVRVESALGQGSRFIVRLQRNHRDD